MANAYEATLTWTDGVPAGIEGSIKVVAGFLPTVFSDSDLNDIGRALEDWASAKLETTVTLDSISALSIDNVAVTP